MCVCIYDAPSQCNICLCRSPLRSGDMSERLDVCVYL